MKKVLVTGGAGYIGSHTIVDLQEKGFEVIAIDNFHNARPSVYPAIEKITNKKVPFHTTDLANYDELYQVFKETPNITGIIHFAALRYVGESVEQPLDYFKTNITGLLNLLDCAKEFKVPNFIFSSSCSVYGNIQELPVVESTTFGTAESPYGRTKQMGEHILEDCVNSPSFNMKVISLRYFNPAGAHESSLIGEDHTHQVSNLVPVITEVAIGKREKLIVFGNDYPTRDGSCVRDYVHIMDLANAHTKALEHLISNKQTTPIEAFNLGMGEGVTVMEAIRAFEKITGRSLNHEIGPRRSGDVIAVYANNDKARQVLGWFPKRGIEQIMDSAWKWEVSRNNGAYATHDSTNAPFSSK